MDFKVPFPDIDLNTTDPELYSQDIERWAKSIPTVEESQSLLPKRGGTLTVFGPKGCVKPKVIVNKVDRYTEELENSSKLRLFINHKEVDIDEYKTIHTTVQQKESEIPLLARSDAIDIYKTPLTKYLKVSI